MSNRPRPNAATRIIVRDALRLISDLHKVPVDMAASLAVEVSLDVYVAHHDARGAADEADRQAVEVVRRNDPRERVG